MSNKKQDDLAELILIFHKIVGIRLYRFPTTNSKGEHFFMHLIDALVGNRYSRKPAMARSDEPSVPLNPATFHILLALAAENLHGYGIMLEIERQSQGKYRLGPGTLYDNLKKLMDYGLVVDAPKKGKDEEKRRMYHLTSQGRVLLKEEIRRLEQVISEAKPYLGARRPRKA